MDVTKDSLITTYSEKDTDELLALHQSGNLSDNGYTAIESVMTQRKIEIPIRPIQYANIDTEDSLKKYWRGKKSLASSFWVVSVIGSIVVIFLAFAVSSLSNIPYSNLAIYVTITNPYFIFLTVVLWRNSKHSSKRLLKFISLFILTIILTSPFYFYAFILLKR